MSKRRFVLLDRDGTIIRKHDYLADPCAVELLPGAAEGLRRLRSMGFGLTVISNQSGLGRGLFDSSTLAAIHRRLAEILREEGVSLDGIYFCPHRPEEDCTCRKPRPGLVRQAARELDFDPSECFVVGDNVCDVELGRAIDATTILVRTGYGAELAGSTAVRPDYVADDLADAARLIGQLPGRHRDSPAVHPMYAPREAEAITQVRAGVGVIIRDAQGWILLEKRSDSGAWGLPGGKIEPGESIRDTALREVLEETGLTVEIVALQGVYSEPAEHIVTYPDNVVQLVDTVLQATVVSGRLTRSAESEELRFFPADQLPTDLVPPARGILDDFRAGRNAVIR
jgi:D-glycero-D-manno-heptose 1,7-bisphosphate phosphatase